MVVVLAVLQSPRYAKYLQRHRKISLFSGWICNFILNRKKKVMIKDISDKMVGESKGYHRKINHLLT